MMASWLMTCFSPQASWQEGLLNISRLTSEPETNIVSISLSKTEGREWEERESLSLYEDLSIT